MSETASAASRVLVERAAKWLMDQALKDTDLDSVVRGSCERLYAAGVPIARVNFSFSMLHPLYSSVGYTWRRGQGLQIDAFRHSSTGARFNRYRTSPYYHMIQHNLDHLRRRLDTGGATEFPVFDDLRENGITDYLAFSSSFAYGTGRGMVGSWSTDQNGGFSDGEIEALLHIQNPLAVASKMVIGGGVAKNALSTYLGAKAGERVLAGQIKRGDGESVRAAIVWGDLRNSSTMADQLGRQIYIDTLNAFFDATAGAVADAGGEILSFIGDGFLAVFPCEDNQKGSCAACALALSAALEATHRVVELNRQRAESAEPALGYGLSLHIGDVMFGNVGLAERLAFSVFGSAVNEASRLETLTKKFATPIVASKEFREYCSGAWEELGRESLRGINTPIDVFRPAAVDGEHARNRIIKRSLVRDLSDAEEVVLLHRDSPA
jgi:adenylate cyclase